MSKSIQIREVPDDVHRVLKARAAKAGMSLSGYLQMEIREIAERPTLANFATSCVIENQLLWQSTPPAS